MLRVVRVGNFAAWPRENGTVSNARGGKLSDKFVCVRVTERVTSEDCCMWKKIEREKKRKKRIGTVRLGTNGRGVE